MHSSSTAFLDLLYSLFARLFRRFDFSTFRLFCFHSLSDLTLFPISHSNFLFAFFISTFLSLPSCLVAFFTLLSSIFSLCLCNSANGNWLSGIRARVPHHDTREKILCQTNPSESSTGTIGLDFAKNIFTLPASIFRLFDVSIIAFLYCSRCPRFDFSIIAYSLRLRTLSGGPQVYRNSRDLAFV